MFESKQRPDSSNYTALWTGEQDKECLDRALPDRNVSTARRRVNSILLYGLPWTLVITLTLVSTMLYAELQKQAHFGRYGSDFKTDFSFPSKIPLQKVRFRGSPHFDGDGNPWAEPPDKSAPWPENVQYVGDPNSEMDANWQHLIAKRYFSLSEEEAHRAWGDRRHDYVDHNAGGYTAGFDVFHTLHCLNEIRKSLHPEYYFEDGRAPEGAAFHNDHCIEILRQTVQCYGSTTLIPTTYIDGIAHNYIDSDQQHVCRSFTFLREYTESRARGGELAVHRDQSLVNATKQALSKAWGAQHGNNHHSGSE